MAGPIIGVILAGGRAERMGGGDKALRTVGGTTILARVIARLRPQVDGLVLNANGDPARFAEFQLPVIGDAVPDYAGPLAGVLAGMGWSATHRGANAIVTVPGDGPFVPRDLVARFMEARARDDAEIVLAASGGQLYPVVGLWSTTLRTELREALVEGVRKVDAWANRFRVAIADFPADPIDPFFNANTPEQLAEAERLAQLYPNI